MEATNENAHLRGKLAASLAAYEAQRQFSQGNLAAALWLVSELEGELEETTKDRDKWMRRMSERDSDLLDGRGDSLAAHDAQVRREALELAVRTIDSMDWHDINEAVARIRALIEKP